MPRAKRCVCLMWEQRNRRFFFCTFSMRELMKSLNGTENSVQNIASVFVKFCSLSLESQRVNLFCVSHLINRYTFFLIDDDHHVFLFSTLNCVSNDNVSLKKYKMKRFHWGLNRPSLVPQRKDQLTMYFNCIQWISNSNRSYWERIRTVLLQHCHYSYMLTYS